MLLQTFVHYFLHFGFPLVIAFVFFRKEWKKAYLILLATMLVDLDHLLASPIFEASRCGFGFHLLHSYWAISIYTLLLFFKQPYRVIGIGLLFHMLTDLIDCLFSYHRCGACVADAPAFGLLKGISEFLGI
ncbi:MAG: DUF6122 family protein [Bacteroidota bacterium]